VILVDSSVWIDYLRGIETPQALRLDELLGVTPLAIGDLILTEVLQGCTSDKAFNEVRRLLSTLAVVTLGGADVAVAAAKNFRKLRARGITARKTIDTVIATRCIVDGYELLHSDRDFDAFERHLGLRCVRCEA
jgi:predicted nucleic acid-binding protein